MSDLGSVLALRAALQLQAIGPVPGTLLLGLGSAAFIWIARLAIRKRRKRGRVGGSTPLEADGDGRAVAAREPDPRAAVAFTLPVPWADPPGRAITGLEVHAIELGLVGGALLAWLASLALVSPLVGTVAGAAMGLVSFWRIRTMAVSTVQAATVPWLGATVVGAAVGVLFFF